MKLLFYNLGKENLIMHSLKKIFAIIPVLAVFSCANTPSTEVIDKTPHKILFIGNSFTYWNSLDVIVSKIGENLGINLECKRFAVGAHSLLEDATDGDSLGTQIFADLRKNQYTDIVLQDKSNYPYNNPSNFRNGVKQMKEKIVPLQPNAKLYLYETWGYNSESLTEPIPKIEQTIRTNTENVAELYDMSVAYVGKAFTNVFENHKDINLYDNDNKHPSYAGSFLSALVHVATITGNHVRSVTYQGEAGRTSEQGQVTFVDEVTRNVLIDVAEQAVFGK